MRGYPRKSRQLSGYLHVLHRNVLFRAIHLQFLAASRERLEGRGISHSLRNAQRNRAFVTTCQCPLGLCQPSGWRLSSCAPWNSGRDRPRARRRMSWFRRDGRFFGDPLRQSPQDVGVATRYEADAHARREARGAAIDTRGPRTLAKANARVEAFLGGMACSTQRRLKKPRHHCLGSSSIPATNGRYPSSMLETGVGVLPGARVKTRMDDRRHRLAFREITHDHG